MSDTSDIAAMAIKLATSPTVFKDSRGVEYIALPAANGSFNYVQLTPASEVPQNPANPVAHVQLAAVASLITYVNRFKTDDTMLFADKDTAQVVAVIDYHKAEGSKPGLRDHLATLTLKHSPEWLAWARYDDHWFTQEMFAQFLAERKRDVVKPDGATLQELVLDMEKGANLRVSRKMTTAFSDRGSRDTSTDVGGTDIPPEWMLQLPVYSGEPMVGMTVFAKDRLQGSELTFGYRRSQVDQIIEAELTRIADAIAAATSVTMVLGTPE